MGCFSVSSRAKREAPGSPQSFSSKESADKPVELLSNHHDSSGTKKATRKPAKSAKSQPGSRRLNDDEETRLDRGAAEVKDTLVIGFSAPLTGSIATAVETSSFSGLLGPSFSSFSYDSNKNKSKTCSFKRAVSLRRASSFGGRPQPLPVPVAADQELNAKPENRRLSLPLPATSQEATSTAIGSTTGSSTSRSELGSMSGTSSFVSTSSTSSSSRPSSFVSQDGIGSWSIRRGPLSPVCGMPLPPPSVAAKLLPSLEAYEFRDLARATQEFAPECCLEMGDFGAVYRAWIKDSSRAGAAADDSSKTEMAVVRLPTNGLQGFKEWRSEVQMLAQLPDANICMVKGYCAHEERAANGEKRRERLLVFEQPPNGSLHDYLFGHRSATSLDWTARINIILGAARGLLYLHDRAPLQIVYREFRASSVLLNKDFTPRLAGYGMAVTCPSPVDKKPSFATDLKTSQAHAKSNVWSFGVVLLELLTGKYGRDAAFSCDQKSFVQWGRPFLKDESKLSLVLDPRIKGQCPMAGATKVAALALQCLQKKETQRPSMSGVVDALKAIKERHGHRAGSRNPKAVSRLGASSRKFSLEGQTLPNDEATVEPAVSLFPCSLEIGKVDGCQGGTPSPFVHQIEAF